MTTPVKSVQFGFTSDGTSLSLSLDLSTQPTALALAGSVTQGIQSLVILGAAGVPVTGTTWNLVGSVLTLTFAAALPTNDNSATLIQYQVSFLLQF